MLKMAQLFYVIGFGFHEFSEKNLLRDGIIKNKNSEAYFIFYIFNKNGFNLIH